MSFVDKVTGGQAKAPDAQGATTASGAAPEAETPETEVATPPQDQGPSAADENQRIFAILDHEDSKGNIFAAIELAREPGMTVNAAVRILGTLPKGETSGTMSSFMDGQPQPSVGMDADAPESQATDKQTPGARMASIMAKAGSDMIASRDRK